MSKKSGGKSFKNKNVSKMTERDFQKEGNENE
jgi:hypothetical protein